MQFYGASFVLPLRNRHRKSLPSKQTGQIYGRARLIKEKRLLFMEKHSVHAYEMYIDGKWTGKDLEQIDVINPATNELLATVPKGGEKEAKAAVDAASAAFPEWSKKTAEQRSDLLKKW